MPVEFASLVALAAISALIAWPALDAWRRRALSREAALLAQALQSFASSARTEEGRAPLDAGLLERITRLRSGVPEVAGLLLAQELGRLMPEHLADAAERLALRLKRRVAFERKMLARAASGLRRGAVAAICPPAIFLALAGAGFEMPLGGLIALLLLEAMGCWLLWRLARVEI